MGTNKTPNGKTAKTVPVGKAIVATSIIVGVGMGSYVTGNQVGYTSRALRPIYVVDGTRLEAAQTMVDTLAVRSADEAPDGYNASKLPGWADSDGDSCSVRYEVLYEYFPIRESDGTKCGIKSGTGIDYYDTGKTLTYDSSIKGGGIEIDHMVSKKNAWISGGHNWTTDQWKYFINYKPNLIATSAGINSQKGSKDISEWQPNNKKFICRFAISQIETKAQFGLSVTDLERDTLKQSLATCRKSRATTTSED